MKAEYNFNYNKAKPNRFTIQDEESTVSDLQKYIQVQVANNLELTQDFDEGFADFKRDVLCASAVHNSRFPTKADAPK